VVEACDGKDALTKLQGDLGLILTDLNMPNMNGIELIRNVRATPAYKFIPIVMLTTESQDGKKSEGKAAGATGWIVKPFKPEQLLAVVAKVIR
jgi:two-component system chemotaxis response regulator CheY